MGNILDDCKSSEDGSFSSFFEDAPSLRERCAVEDEHSVLYSSSCNSCCSDSEQPFGAEYCRGSAERPEYLKEENLEAGPRPMAKPRRILRSNSQESDSSQASAFVSASQRALSTFRYVTRKSSHLSSSLERNEAVGSTEPKSTPDRRPSLAKVASQRINATFFRAKNKEIFHEELSDGSADDEFFVIQKAESFRAESSESMGSTDDETVPGTQNVVGQKQRHGDTQVIQKTPSRPYSKKKNISQKSRVKRVPRNKQLRRSLSADDALHESNRPDEPINNRIRTVKAPSRNFRSSSKAVQNSSNGSRVEDDPGPVPMTEEQQQSSKSKNKHGCLSRQSSRQSDSSCLSSSSSDGTDGLRDCSDIPEDGQRKSVPQDKTRSPTLRRSKSQLSNCTRASRCSSTESQKPVPNLTRRASRRGPKTFKGVSSNTAYDLGVCDRNEKVASTEPVCMPYRRPSLPKSTQFMVEAGQDQPEITLVSTRIANDLMHKAEQVTDPYKRQMGVECAVKTDERKVHTQEYQQKPLRPDSTKKNASSSSHVRPDRRMQIVQDDEDKSKRNSEPKTGSQRIARAVLRKCISDPVASLDSEENLSPTRVEVRRSVSYSVGALALLAKFRKTNNIDSVLTPGNHEQSLLKGSDVFLAQSYRSESSRMKVQRAASFSLSESPSVKEKRSHSFLELAGFRKEEASDPSQATKNHRRSSSSTEALSPHGSQRSDSSRVNAQRAAGFTLAENPRVKIERSASLSLLQQKEQNSDPLQPTKNHHRSSSRSGEISRNSSRSGHSSRSTKGYNQHHSPRRSTHSLSSTDHSPRKPSRSHSSRSTDIPRSRPGDGPRRHSSRSSGHRHDRPADHSQHNKSSRRSERSHTKAKPIENGHSEKSLAVSDGSISRRALTAMPT
jgi:hypothetical protein